MKKTRQSRAARARGSGGLAWPVATAAFAGGNNEQADSRQLRPPMLTPMMHGVQVEPLLTVGDVLPSGYRFEAIPDGISVAHAGAGARRTSS